MTNRYKSLSTLVRVVSVTLVLYAVTSAIVGVLSLRMTYALQAGLLDIIKTINSMSSWKPIGTIHTLLFLVHVVLFCFWLYRANANARALGAEGMRFSPGWAVGWLFVPIMNFFRPYQVVREIWKASDPHASSQWDQLPTPALIKTWWATSLLSYFEIRLINPSITRELVTFLMVGVAIKVLAQVVNCLLAILLVRRIHHRQEAKAAGVLTEVGG
jgi:hypothetical protein